MPKVFVVLGSNIEPKSRYLDLALAELAQTYPVGFAASSAYRSLPYQGLEQAAYLNRACTFETTQTANVLLESLLALELKLGRKRTGLHWDERTLDLDIALYGDLVLSSPDLTLPHYDLANRDFFLVPLLELDPRLVDPRSGQPLRLLLEALPPSLKTQLEPWPDHDQG
ncbi:MAG: 2-amino-4-hydroxy-6-hydroxymethyldihydropteridine diphosphokinase [Candidatus Lambdaproteobacteria bacterium RIFOXYD1_FULL_56_27]|uniref:2-amino-4-hydroxy-6-hydroxymethyldihydropteridine pyrophosphokinase n=1 Tax=Candidatus Lambdaproteobacteria bacterium RIFOXYD2_FULL_56_26 TaxID=1817773 RepID=A0A1F6H0D2_9PROT|nr:MAG: 2-amino-4-hydroxy-6-hydroxymethyldihydropteridine diphosphokinase [Candidatus Lambdaproteobacteria bacterium RIFOXYC1_FULL_56_13]OGH03853.1 MAG: 2-amino-4-hydroxy-6-hydroxymethyldihydropteridine diphosphokinase [Candidatus Lambdaproteobacteria bacterium RIFOXYD2_FULL_56_26]OGH08981.1 MAG: 2-amino-4-hydroxy-6-hydroxymethyldihydropteridine diphosphokinase [Candidatus Lambdaproteobacteria bacterium RIFOXYD1_FULL_56_27]